MKMNKIVYFLQLLIVGVVPVQAVIVDYQEGWNLVASGASTEYSSLIFHQNRTDYLLGISDRGEWTSYTEDGLQILGENKGAWVRFNENVAGFSVTALSQDGDYSSLVEGWNLIGPGQSETVDELKTVIENNYSSLEVERIYTFNSGVGWSGFDFEREVGTLRQLDVSNGVWVKLVTPSATVLEREILYDQLSVRGFADDVDLQFEVVTEPEKGSLVLQVDGALAGVYSYTPDDNRSGEDSFEFRAFVGEQGAENYQVSDVVTVRIQINAAMQADAGEAQEATGWKQIVLDGSESEHHNGSITSYHWEQLGGEAVDLVDNDQAIASLTAPNRLGTLEFKLTVSDDEGRENVDTVEVIVNQFGISPQFVRPALVAIQTMATSDDASQRTSFPVWASSLEPASLQRGESIALQSGLQSHSLYDWLSPLNSTVSLAETERLGYGVNALVYIGQGWDSDWDGDTVAGSALYGGEGSDGSLWVAHDDLALVTGMPSEGVLPAGVHQDYSMWSQDLGKIDFNSEDVEQWSGENLADYLVALRSESGGSLLDVNLSQGQWVVNNQGNWRIDGTSDHQLNLYGDGVSVSAVDQSDSGQELSPGVIAGLDRLQSALLTPWGSILSTDANRGTNSPFGGYLMELLPKESSGDGGSVQRALTSMGKGGWQDVALATGEGYTLIDGSPLVLYLVDGRAGGRIYKWVSEGNYVTGMSRNTVRNLLRSGTLYVASVEGLSGDDGYTIAQGVRAGEFPAAEDLIGGQWLELGVDYNLGEIAPNSAILSDDGGDTLVGEAMSSEWNGVSPLDQESILTNPDQAANKIGVMELNRPYDLAWQPGSIVDDSGNGQVVLAPHLVVVFKGQGEHPLRLDSAGRLITAEESERSRSVDLGGAVYVLYEQGGDPASSALFTLQHLWGGDEEQRVYPEQVLLDSNGDIWVSEKEQATLYYLDRQQEGDLSPVEVLKSPDGFQLGGATWNSDQSTLFIGIEPEDVN